MPLRPINNPNTDVVLMNILKTIIPVDTQVTSSQVYIQQKYKMALNMTPASPIAINMSAGQQRYMKESFKAYTALTSIEMGYYSRWDEQDQAIDAIWADIAADLERVKANIEGNDATEYAGANHTISLAEMVLSPYEGEFDQTFTGLTLVKRSLTLVYNVLPYGI